MKVKHNTQRKLAHVAVYHVHDVLRDDRIVMRLIQTNHYTRQAYNRVDRRGRGGRSGFVDLYGPVKPTTAHIVWLVSSPKPPKTVIRGLINWKE